MGLRISPHSRDIPLLYALGPAVSCSRAVVETGQVIHQIPCYSRPDVNRLPGKGRFEDAGHRGHPLEVLLAISLQLS